MTGATILVTAADLQALLQTGHCPLQTGQRLQPNWLVVLRLAQKKLLLIFGSARDAVPKQMRRHDLLASLLPIKVLVKEASRKTAMQPAW